MKRQISSAFAALCATGSQTHQIAGAVMIAAIPNTSLMAAARLGIPLPHAVCARAAVISGDGPHACAAMVGHYTKSGIQKDQGEKLTQHHHLLDP